MALGKRTSIIERVKRAVLAAFSVSLLAGQAVAGPPEPPLRSEIALRILPFHGQTELVDRQALDDHPLFRLIRLAGSELLGIEPLRFLDSTFEGTVVAAVLSRPAAEGSSLRRFFRHRQLVDRWERDVEELRQLSSDLQDYYQTTEAYPEDLEAYIQEVRYYEPYLSPGVSYRYELLDDGQDFRLTMVFEDGAETSSLGRPPAFSGQTGERNVEPTLETPPLNLVVGAKITNKAALQEVLTRELGPSRNGFWYNSSSSTPFVVTVRGDWVVASDRLANLGPFLRALNGEEPGWNGNPGFQKVARNISVDGPFTLFVDTPRLLSALDIPASGPVRALAELVGPFGYAAVPYEESQFRLEMFLGVNPPAESELARYFSESNSPTPTQLFEVANIPWDASNVFALHYGNSKALIDSLVGLFPEFEMQFDMGQDVMLGMLGLDAEAGLEELIEGPAILSFERVDLFAAGLESFYQAAAAVEEESGEAEVEMEEPLGEGSTPEEVVEEPELPALEQEPGLDEPPRPGSATSPMAYFPAALAFQVPIDSNREALVDLLRPSMGETESRSLFGVDLITSEDGRLTYAVDDDWLYLSGGRTDRLIRYMLEAAHGRRSTLASIDSWSRFTLGSRGRLLAFGHQKVDAFNSIAKGVLLLLGSEFRPLATEIGKLRDYHAVITAVPDGLLMVGEMVQGDER